MLLGEGSDEIAEDQRDKSPMRAFAIMHGIAEGLAHCRRIGLAKRRWVKAQSKRVERFHAIGAAAGGGHERPPWGSRPSERAEATAASSLSSSTARTLWPRLVRR